MTKIAMGTVKCGCDSFFLPQPADGSSQEAWNVHIFDINRNGQFYLWEIDTNNRLVAQYDFYKKTQPNPLDFENREKFTGWGEDAGIDLSSECVRMGAANDFCKWLSVAAVVTVVFSVYLFWIRNYKSSVVGVVLSAAFSCIALSQKEARRRASFDAANKVLTFFMTNRNCFTKIEGKQNLDFFKIEVANELRVKPLREISPMHLDLRANGFK